LKELGLSYVLDWCADDEPFLLKVPGMISVPDSIELNDVTMVCRQESNWRELLPTRFRPI